MSASSDTGDGSANSLTMQAMLSPADAAAARDLALESILPAKAGQTSLQVELDGEALSPCAVQLLVGATRTAEKQEVEIVLSEQAQTILSNIDLS